MPVSQKSFDRLAKKVYPIVLTAFFVLFIILLISILRRSIFGEVELHKYAFFEISFLLLIAVLAEIGVIYSKQPSAILLLLVGVIMSESILGFKIFRDEQLIYLFAQLGSIFLLFRVGLHSHFKSIFSKENAIVAMLGVVVPFAGGFAYATLTGGNFVYSMFLGAALTATSVGVSVAIIKEAGLMSEKFAQVIIGAAVIDDILGLLVLSFVLNLPADLNLAESALPLAKIAGATIVFLGGGIIAGNWFVKNVLDKLEMTNANFLIALVLLHLYSYIAEVIGLSAIVGAFIAGLLLTNSKHIKELEDKVYPLETIFVPIFFISLGLLVNLNDIIAFAWPIIIISIIAILTKIIGCGVGALASGMNRIESAIIGFGMAPRAEVALIVASLGLQRAAISQSEYAIIAAMALLTTIFPPFVMNYLIAKRKK
ncbi:cation:proton antiporter [Candidatus Micrarchaeota archaeon]|nr:cation:proton antiporter [Candidatus Micrarchaeota archaeon]